MNKLVTLLVASLFCINANGAQKITNDDRTVILGVNSDGSIQLPVIAQVPFLDAVAFGLVDGYGIVNKFGHNPEATTGEDMWPGGGAYTFYPTNAQSVWAVSDSASDDTSSTGAHTVIFYGLDSDWLEASETVTMDGATSVALTNTYNRLFRGVVLTIGTAESNVGNISVTNSAGVVGIYIAASDGQTQQAIYTIPADKSAVFKKGYVALRNDTFQGESGDFKWQMRLNNGTTGAWQTKGQMGLVNIGSSWWQYEYSGPAGIIPGKTDIRIIQSNATDTMDSVAGYDLLLKDN